MEVPFLKMQGCADDVVVLDAVRQVPGATDDLGSLARRVLHRGTGVGGSALVVVDSSGGAVAARVAAPDGSDRAPWGTALRCAARYAADGGAVSAGGFSVSAGGRARRAQIIDSANVRLDSGTPLDAPGGEPLRESPRRSYAREILVDGRRLAYTPVTVDRPWAVVVVDDFAFPLRRTARAIAAHPGLRDDTTVAFVQVWSRDQARVRTSGGPGVDADAAGPALVAAVVNGFADREAIVHLRGGDLFVQWDADDRLWITGPAAYVFTGTWDAPDAVPADGDA